MQEVSCEKNKHYRSFTTLLESEYRNETSNYVNDGYYDICVGNLMPLSMANILHASFVMTNHCMLHLKIISVMEQSSLCTRARVKATMTLHFLRNIPTEVTDSAVMETADIKCVKKEVLSCLHRPLHVPSCASVKTTLILMVKM